MEEKKLTVRLPVKMVDSLKLVAEQDGMTLNGIVLFIFAEYIRKRVGSPVSEMQEEKIETILKKIEAIEQTQHKHGALITRNKKAIETGIELDSKLFEQILFRMVSKEDSPEERKQRTKVAIADFVSSTLAYAREQAEKKI